MEDLGCHTTHVETKFWDIRKVPTLAHLKKTGKHIANELPRRKQRGIKKENVYPLRRKRRGIEPTEIH